ncbi:hypothetical protein COV18_01255 [Candidatus Woesearchaeota archaeon CG10_big_fil_rev_8_21_14_0_10_37_12]|nr:MAG: hypothetical protein COV18_01255 [Candidatus Woesearchaeota archaeon CG10_big_fil_rev_8_21_14_0_10_37_12]
MKKDKEVFALWKEINPVSAFGAGLKENAGTLWISSSANIKHALLRIKQLEKNADPVAKKFLNCIKTSILFEEPQHPPNQILSAYFTHLTIEGINEKHVLQLAEQGISLLGVQKHLWEKKWPIELQIFTAQECSGAKAILDTIKKQCKKQETKDAITALQKRIDNWKENITKIQIKKGDFNELFSLLKKKATLQRKNIYNKLITTLYDHTETPEQIERLALSWVDKELPVFKTIVKKLSQKYKCKATVESISEMLKKKQAVKTTDLLNIIATVRKKLQPVAEKEWVQITPKYDVRLIETPSYLTPFLPTAAMDLFGTLSNKPFCLYFVTTDKTKSPMSDIPDLVQTTIHEEYGHCVNLMNSAVNTKNRIIEKISSSLEIPLTEGLSFFRELEGLSTFKKIRDTGAKNKEEKVLVNEIEKHVPFEEFVLGVSFVVYQWRMVRFLRAISDVRVNTGKQKYPAFIEWAHKKTGLSKKLIFHQTFFFQEMPGYAPSYSLFGQQLKKYQHLAMKKGISQKAFNTYVAGRGFPARSVFEKELKKKFKI